MAMEGAWDKAGLVQGRGLIVKRTFLELVEEEQSCMGSPTKYTVVRASSDSALYENSLEAQERALTARAAGGGSAEGTESDQTDFELRGLSDSESDSASQAGSAEQHSVDTWSELPHIERLSQCSKAPSTTDTTSGNRDEGVQGLMALLRENARLADENRRLRENAHLQPATPTVQAPSEPSYFGGQSDFTVFSGGWCESATDVQPSAPKPAQGKSAATPAVPPGIWYIPVGSYPSPLDAYDAMQLPLNEAEPSKRSQRRKLKRAKAVMDAADGGSSPAVKVTDASEEPPTEGDERTTVMLRNLPNNYTRAMLCGMLDDGGFAGLYDFIYLPIDFGTQACLGYAFVNLVEPAVVRRFWETFSGFTDWAFPSKKVCRVTWSGPHQGQEAHVERYRNSPVMHASVPEDYKPLVLRAGEPVPFPAPTKTPKPPRTRNGLAAGSAA